jgi:hypothetical protein
MGAPAGHSPGAIRRGTAVGTRSRAIRHGMYNECEPRMDANPKKVLFVSNRTKFAVHF